MLTLSIELLTRMHAHLEAGYPHEACGILIGDITFAGAGDLAMPDGHGDATPRQTPIRYRRAPTLASKIVKDLVLVPNVWSIENERESQRNRFLISPDDVARADRAGRQARPGHRRLLPLAPRLPAAPVGNRPRVRPAGRGVRHRVGAAWEGGRDGLVGAAGRPVGVRCRGSSIRSMNWQERIVLDPNIMAGGPIVTRTRLAIQFSASIS